MLVEAKYCGKWIAIKNEKVIGVDKTLKKLMKKISFKEKDRTIAFTPVPKGYITGCAHEIQVLSV